MELHRLNAGDWVRALGIGVAIAIVTAAVMQAGMRAGVSPMPQPLGLVFARTVLGDGVPLPVGLLFHAVWVIAAVAAYVLAFREESSLGRALGFGAALWILVLVFFFPVVGWGFLGLTVTPRLIVAAGVIHLVFALLLWGFCAMAFRAARPAR